MNKVKSVLFMAGISLALAFTFSCSSSDDSGGGSSGNSLVVSVSSSSVVISNHSSASESMKYCVYQEMRQCFETYQARCPAGGELSDFCPYGNSSSMVASSSSSMPSSSSSIPSSSSVEGLGSEVSSSSSMPSSSSSSQYSSSSALLEYSYCVFDADKICLAGSLTACPPGGTLSNTCPYDNSSSSVISSSIVSSSSSSSFISSSAISSSSSSMQSSSSVASSSSFSITYTLTCSNIPTSGTAGTAITAPAVICKSSNGTSTSVSSGLNWIDAPNWNNPAAGTYSGVSVAASSGNCSGKTANCGGTLIVTEYTLTCANVPDSALSGVAITAPTVTCTSSNGTSSTVVSSDLNWGRGAPDWNKPVAGTHNTVIVEANSGNCRGKYAICGGTLTIQMNYGTPVTYEGKTYQTVVIGTQTWMTENLNYAVNDSKCYENDEANCATYGRLYNWATAMALPYSCNSSDCASKLSARHRGICPEGWYIPSKNDWDNLLQVGSYISGLNRYGFPVLLGGRGYRFSSSLEFNDVGYSGWWWTATQGVAELAYSMEAKLDMISSKAFNFKENNFYSVRCLKDRSSL